MSIIADALKRAEKEGDDRQPLVIPPDSLVAQKNVEILKDEKKSFSGKRFWVWFLILVGFGAGAGVFYYLNTEKSDVKLDVLIGSRLRSPDLHQETSARTMTPTKMDEAPKLSPALSITPEIPAQPVKEIETPLQASPDEHPPITLNGIMMGEPPQALVNGRFVNEGDSVDGVKVVKIKSDHVVFKFEGKKFRRTIY
ncbi:MAG: general secretion pathway protein GspB [Chlamydiae bacterium]|nr:general secretion pathway protein GspB [Chlamydiota bacterium]MBI3266825.1 general secretion pathway protein GspB [Chlamydiota bacterium]